VARKSGNRRRSHARDEAGGDDRLVVGGPHAVRALLSGGSEIERVFLTAAAGRRAQQIADDARAAGVPVSSVGEAECERLCGARAQGIAAATRFVYADHSDVLAGVTGQSLLVYLDGVTDPHNLGAILRTAAAAGAAAVVIPGRRSAAVTGAVVRVSAGAAFAVPVVRVGNLVQALTETRRHEVWVVGLDHRAERTLTPAPPTQAQALVLGGEGEGLHRLAAETCHELARLPMTTAVESLNASVAAALAIYRLREVVLYGSKSVD
jgi:23S rRNA (guanosine2251-2'-O)-methyltransferase